MTLGISGVQSRMASIQTRFMAPAGFAQALEAAESSRSAERASGAQTLSLSGGPPAAALPLPLGAPPAPATATAPAGHAWQPSVPPLASTAPAGPVPAWAERLPSAAGPWIRDLEAAAARHDIDPRLLASVVRHESGFRPDARSHAGAIGLTQLMPATARGLGVDPHDPVQNLDGGARYLRQMLDRFGTADLALAAYNAGPGRVARAGGIPQNGETPRYVSAVLSSYEQLSRASAGVLGADAHDLGDGAAQSAMDW